jgi:hypothetical protein
MEAMMADFTTGAGGTLSLVLAAPATYTEAGYEALTPIKVGKVTAISGLPTRTYNEVTLNYLESAGEDVAKGSYSLGTTTLTVALDSEDAGQALLQTANDSTAKYTVKLSHPVHGDTYGRALVFGQQKVLGDNDTPSTWDVNIRWTVATSSDDGIVNVEAA